MDLLYSRYSNPLEFMHMYMNQGRFGEFETNIIELNNKRKQEEAEKENEDKLWMMYCHSFSEKSFTDWKRDVVYSTGTVTNDKKQYTSDADMTESEIIGIIDNLFSKG